VRVFRNLHRTDEPVSCRGNGLDEARLVGVVFEHMAKKRDSAGQGAFGDDGISPHGIEQFILGDQMARMVEEVNQHPIGLGFEHERFARPGHAPLSLPDLDVIKPENRVVRDRHRAISRP
jgi:hypothetical protein